MDAIDSKKLITGKDIFLIFAVIAVGFTAVLWSSLKPEEKGPLTAVIMVSGEEIYRINLDAVISPYTVDVGGAFPAEIQIENGAATVSYASCHDKICMKEGRMTQSGQRAVCLPNRMTVYLEGGQKESQIDAITQ